ncbi:MAG: plasmid mobilization relaxosome protein MobC [Ruminococcus sp.]|nr:plasmid mobilization relaxosome protein MobC [Ruminococcus sp.]
MKDKKMSIRISEDNLNIVHYKADQAKLTLTEYVTQCALGKQIFVIDGLDEVLRQQKAIGKNINRLTVLSNMGKISSVNLERLTEEYAELNCTLTEMLDRKRWSA